MPSETDVGNLLTTYSASFDRGDCAAAATVFTDDATMTLSVGDQGTVGTWTGRDEIQGMLQGAADAQQPGEQRRHHVSGVRIEADGDAVTVRSVLLVTRALEGTVAILTSGAQVDQLVRTPDGLRIASRALHVDVPF